MPAIVTSRKTTENGRVVLRIRVVETGARDTSEWSTVGIEHEIPPAGTIVHLQAKLQSGAGTTIQPRLGKATAWADSTMDAIGGVAAAAGYVNEAVPLPYTYAPGSRPVLYGQSKPNSTNPNHTVETLITIVGVG